MLVHLLAHFPTVGIFIKVGYIFGKLYCSGDYFVEITSRFDMPFLLCVSLLTIKLFFSTKSTGMSLFFEYNLYGIYFSVLSICLLIFDVKKE